MNRVEQEGARLDLENRLKEFEKSAHAAGRASRDEEVDALSSLASEVRELVEAAKLIDDRVIEASKALPGRRDVLDSGGDVTIPTIRLKRLRHALSAPGIQKLLKEVK